MKVHMEPTSQENSTNVLDSASGAAAVASDERAVSEMARTLSVTLPAASQSGKSEKKRTRSPLTGQMIFQTIVDLGNSNRIATRQVLVESLGFSYAVVDDHVKRMIEDGRLRRVMSGVFEAVPAGPEDRAISITHLPGGFAKLEIGDVCVELSLREVRMVAMATAGVSLQFGK